MGQTLIQMLQCASGRTNGLYQSVKGVQEPNAARQEAQEM